MISHWARVHESIGKPVEAFHPVSFERRRGLIVGAKTKQRGSFIQPFFCKTCSAHNHDRKSYEDHIKSASHKAREKALGPQHDLRTMFERWKIWWGDEWVNTRQDIGSMMEDEESLIHDSLITSRHPSLPPNRGHLLYNASNPDEQRDENVPKWCTVGSPGQVYFKGEIVYCRDKSTGQWRDARIVLDERNVYWVEFLDPRIPSEWVEKHSVRLHKKNVEFAIRNGISTASYFLEEQDKDFETKDAAIKKQIEVVLREKKDRILDERKKKEKYVKTSLEKYQADSEKISEQELEKAKKELAERKFLPDRKDIYWNTLTPGHWIRYRDETYGWVRARIQERDNTRRKTEDQRFGERQRAEEEKFLIGTPDKKTTLPDSPSYDYCLKLEAIQIISDNQRTNPQTTWTLPRWGTCHETSGKEKCDTCGRRPPDNPEDRIEHYRDPPRRLFYHRLITYQQTLQTTGLHLKLKSMSTKNGSSLFRALSDQIFGTPGNFIFLRHACAKYVADHADYFQRFVDINFEYYIALKKRAAEEEKELEREEREGGSLIFGDHLDLQAVCEMYDVQVKIWTDIETEKPEPSVQFYSKVKTASGKYLPTIRLSYSRNKHYDSLIEVDSKGDRIPLVRENPKRINKSDSTEPKETDKPKAKGIYLGYEKYKASLVREARIQAVAVEDAAEEEKTGKKIKNRGAGTLDPELTQVVISQFVGLVQFKELRDFKSLAALMGIKSDEFEGYSMLQRETRQFPRHPENEKQVVIKYPCFDFSIAQLERWGLLPSPESDIDEDEDDEDDEDELAEPGEPKSKSKQESKRSADPLIGESPIMSIWGTQEKVQEAVNFVRSVASACLLLPVLVGSKIEKKPKTILTKAARNIKKGIREGEKIKDSLFEGPLGGVGKSQS